MKNMPPNYPPQTKPNLTSIRLQIFLSAFVLPGAGQFAQKRWGPGLTYSISFLCCFMYIITRVGMALFQNLRIAVDGNSNESFTQISIPAILISLLIALMIYLANLMDIFRAARGRSQDSEFRIQEK